MEWKSVENEFPEKDGYYYVSNNINLKELVVGLAKYDGIGFIIAHAYRPVRFWKEYIPLEKKYGKVT